MLLWIPCFSSASLRCTATVAMCLQCFGMSSVSSMAGVSVELFSRKLVERVQRTCFVLVEVLQRTSLPRICRGRFCFGGMRHVDIRCLPILLRGRILHKLKFFRGRNFHGLVAPVCVFSSGIVLTCNGHPQEIKCGTHREMSSNDDCGVRTHALSEWRLEPPP